MAISLVDNTAGAGEPLNTGFDKVNQAITRVNQFDSLSTGDISALNTIASITPSDNTFIVGTGTEFQGRTAAQALTDLGLTATATELNYVDGVTSAIQTQLNGKQPLDSELTTLSGMSSTQATGLVGTSGTATFANAKVTGLTFGQVVLPTADGTLSGSANLTFTSGVLDVGGAIDATGDIKASTFSIGATSLNSTEFGILNTLGGMSSAQATGLVGVSGTATFNDINVGTADFSGLTVVSGSRLELGSVGSVSGDMRFYIADGGGYEQRQFRLQELSGDIELSSNFSTGGSPDFVLTRAGSERFRFDFEDSLFTSVGNISAGNTVTKSFTNELSYNNLLRVGSESTGTDNSSSVQIGGWLGSTTTGVVGVLEYFNTRSDAIIASIEGLRDGGTSDGALIFKTTNSERLIIDNSGIGVTGTGTFSGDITAEANLLMDGGDAQALNYALTTDFSGTGWQGSYEGDFNIRNLVVRESARFRELIIDQLAVIAGSDLRSVGRGKIKEVDNTAKTVTLDNPRNISASSFIANDFFWIKEIDIDGSTFLDLKGQITAVTVTTVSGEEVIKLTLDTTVTGGTHDGGTTDLSALNGGEVIVQRGHPTDADRQALIYTSVSDTDAPVQKYFTGIDSLGAFDAVANISTQIGNLEGLTPTYANVTGEGFYSSNAYLTDSILVGDLAKASNYLEYAGGSLTANLGTLDITAGTFEIDSSAEYLQVGTVFNVTGGATNTGTIAGWDASTTGFDNSGTGLFVGAGKNINIINTGSGTAMFTGLFVDSNNYLGNWDGTDYFRVGTSTTYFQMDTGASPQLTMATPELTINSSGATFSGNLSAPSGDIAGWDISTTGFDSSGTGLFVGAGKNPNIGNTAAGTAAFTGLFVDANNYLGIYDGSNLFRVGGTTNYIQRDGADLDIVTDSFNLEAGELTINSANTTYPTYNQTDNVSDASFNFEGSPANSTGLSALTSQEVRFSFNYDFDFASSQSLSVLVFIQARDTGGVWFDLDPDDDYIRYAEFEYLNQTAGSATFSKTSSTGSGTTFVQITGTGTNFEGEYYFYVIINENFPYDEIRLRFNETTSAAFTTCNVSSVEGRAFTPVVELNSGGFFVRESDAIVNKNGIRSLDRSLLI